MSTTKTAPTPTPETPLYTYGDLLADSDGHLYQPDGAAVVIDGTHATIAVIEAEANEYSERGFAPYTTRTVG